MRSRRFAARGPDGRSRRRERTVPLEPGRHLSGQGGLAGREETATSKSFAELEPCKGKLGQSAESLRKCLDTVFAIRRKSRAWPATPPCCRTRTRALTSTPRCGRRRGCCFRRFPRKRAFCGGAARCGQVKGRGLRGDRKRAGDLPAIPRRRREASAHTRSPEVEQVLAQSSPAARSASSIRRTLANAELPWPQIKLSGGEEVRLDTAAYAKYRASPGRGDRKQVFGAFWNVWKQYERTLGASLYSNLLADRFYSQARAYPNSLSAALAEDNIPESVYRTLVRETNAGLPVLHRYFKLRADMLGLDDPAYYDIYPPLVEATGEFTLDQAKELAIAAARPFGRSMWR